MNIETGMRGLCFLSALVVLTGAEIGSTKAATATRKETATVPLVPSATKAVAWRVTFAGPE